MTSTRTQKQVTIDDVARAAGVSLGTVSGAFTGKKRMSEETRQTILLAAKKLHYQPNPHAQRLANGRCRNTIIVLSLAQDLGVATQTSEGIQRRLQEQGFSVPLSTYHYWSARSGLAQLDFVRDACSQKPRALVCNTTYLLPESWREIMRYRDEGGIVICYGFSSSSIDVDLVCFDEEDSTYQAVRHLLETGHRRIGYSMHGGEAKLDTTRVQGMRRALAECGLKLRPDWVLRSGMYEEGGARLAENYLALRRRPTALCIVNDVTAAFFVQQLMRRGLRVPHDVSVVGQDDTPAAAHCIVPLSTVSQPVDEVAEGVCALLKQRLDGSDEPPQKIVVRGRLIRRESVASPAPETSAHENA